jgi:hypothetical protein
MGLGLLDMGNYAPWTPSLSCGYLAPKSSSVSICSWQYIYSLYFNLHHSHIGSRQYITFTIYIAILGLKMGMLH